MPLPPVNTLDAADQIGQVPEPDRMNVGPKPVAPQPLPGTGLTIQGDQQKGGFSQDYINTVLGAKPNYDPGHPQVFSGQEVYNPRYSSVLPGEDSEEAFAKAQPWYKKWGNAMTKMAATTVGTFWNGITSIPDTIASLSNGKTPYNTDSGGQIDQWLKNLEDRFPNYYTKWEQAHPFASAIPFSGGAANFWSDKFLKNLGFTAGAIGSAALQDLAVGAVTEGIGEIPLIGNQVGRAALYLNKLFTGTDKVGELLELGRQAGRTEKQLIQLRDLARAAQAVKVSNGIRFATNLYGAAASEAGMEARDGYTTVKKDLTDDYIKEHGYAPIGKDLDEIDKYATSSANIRFGVNLAILGMSDAIQFDNFLKPFSAAKNGWRSTMQKALEGGEEGIGKIGLKEGSIDEFEKQVPKTVGGKVWQAFRPTIPAILSEGVYEEGGQYAAQIGTQNYYERKYLYDKGMSKDLYKSDNEAWNAKDNINNIIHSVLNGLAGEFGTTEGQENIFLGALTGAFSAGVERFMDRKKIDNNTKSVLDLLNKRGVTGILSNNYDTAVGATRIAADMKRAAKYNDAFKYKNFQHEQFVEFITSGLKAGRFDVRMAQLDLLKDMSNEEFKKSFGLDKNSENVGTVSDYITTLKEKAQAIKRSYELIDDTFQNPYKYRSKTRTEDQIAENERHQEFEKYKDTLTYLSSIISDSHQRQRSIEKSIKDISEYINPGFVKDLTNRESIKDYIKTLKANISILEKGLENSGTKVFDKAKIKLFNDKIEQMEKNLANPNHEDHSKMFEDILNFQLNGETGEANITVPKAAIQKLMEYGRDLNRLDEYRRSANDAFEKLSDRKGFEKFVNQIREFRRQQAEEQEKAQQQQTRKQAQQPADTITPITPPVPTPPPAPKTIELKNSKGETVSFLADNDYMVDLGDGAEPIKVVGQNKDGVVVQRADGQQVTVPLNQFFAEDELSTEIDDSLNENTSVENVPPPSNQETPINKRGESKKDISFGPMTTTDPPYDRKDTPDDNFQRRHQNFLFNIGSTDPKVFNQEVKKYLRIIPVTYNTQAALGLEGWITDESNDSNTAPIRYIYVADLRNAPEGTADSPKPGIYLVNGEGQIIDELGEELDPSQIIYTNAPDTSLAFGNEERYTNKQNLDEKAIVDSWRVHRAALLAETDINNLPLHQFEISRGIPNETDPDTRNSIVKIGIVTEQDLDGPVIEVLTLGNVAVAGALNNEGEGIAAHKTSVNMGDMGKKVFNFGGNMWFLDPRKLTENEAGNIFEMLKLLSDRNFKEKSAVFKYLNKILYLPNIGKGQATSATSIAIQGINLFLGKSTIPILMNAESLDQNKDKIIAFLKDSFHDVNNSELLRIAKNPKANDLTFNELRVKDGKLETVHEWKNYNHYLLSDKTPDGSRRDNVPMTTKIVVPQEGEVPFIQKYSVLKGIQLDTKVVQNRQQQTQQQKQKQQETNDQKLTKLGWKPEIVAKLSEASKKSLADNNMTPEDYKRSREQAQKEQGTQDAGTKTVEVKSEPKAEKETKKEPEKQERVVEFLEVGGKKLGFTDVVRDANGYVTDLTPVGVINDDDSVTPYKNPDAVKVIIMKKLQESQLKQDSTNDKKSEDDLDNLMNDPKRKKGDDSQYRLNTISEKIYTKADLEKEFSEFQKILPGVPIHKVDQMIRTTGGGLAWGVLRNGMVHIYQNAEVGTTYHEAFEAVWGHFLTGREQQDLYDEFTGREGTFVTYTGQTKDFKNATVKEAKEQIAEEFRDYKMAAKKSPKNRLERFFQAIIDFIKRFILGDRSNINRAFRRLNRGYYRSFAPLIDRAVGEDQYRRPGLEEFSESTIQDTIQGMTVDMFMDLFKENQDIITQLEENPEVAAKTIYDKLLSNLTHYFEENSTEFDDTLLSQYIDEWRKGTSETKEVIRGQIRSVRDLWAKVKGNWDNFVKEHKRYLKVFNVEYEIDDEGNISFVEDDSSDIEDNKNQVQYDRDIFQIDAKNAASPKIKILVATIADSVWKKASEASVGAALKNETVINRQNSVLTLPKQAQYAKLFNYMLHNLSNINGLYNMWDKLKDMTSNPETRKAIDANVQRVMVRLGLNQGFKGKGLDNAKIALAFENVMSKQKPAFFRQFVDGTGNTYFKTSVLNSKLDQVKSKWISGMRASNLVTVATGGNFLFDLQATANPDNIGFLKDIGIDISQGEYDKLKSRDKTKFNNAVNKIRASISKAAKEERAIAISSPREVDFSGRLNDLAELYISNISGDDSQSQHPNLDGEQTSNFVLGNFLSSQISDANNSDTKEEFINKTNNQFYNDIFHADSILLNQLFFDKSGKRTEKQIEIGVTEGRESWNGENGSASSLSDPERQVYEINSNLNGVYYTLLPADAKTEWCIYTGTYISADKFFGTDTERNGEVTTFTRQMYKWLGTEIKLAQDYKNRTNIEALNRDLGDRKVGNSLRFFGDILDKETIDKINKRVIDGNEPLDKVITEPELRSQLQSFINQKAIRTLNNLLEWNLIDYSQDENHYKLNGFDRNFLETHLGDEEFYNQEQVAKLMRFREMNYLMNNIEMHKFFFGDPAQYKDELKRVKSFLSGRENTHVDTLGTDEGLNQVLDGLLNRTSENGPILQRSDPGFHDFKNHLNTFTLYDVEYTSAELKDIQEAIGEKRAKPYDKGNEADAQALMMATAYREIMHKSGGRFTNAQEKYFQWAMAWERNDKAKDGLYEYTNKDLERADKELLKEEEPEAYFPIIKLVHSGVQYENGVAIASLDKASWAPMFYHWYKGTTTGKMYNQLQAKGIDYVRMESAHKVGIQKNASERLYNEKGEYNKDAIDKVQSEAISMKHIGIQVEQSKKDKGQTEGSQARKIVPSDLMSNGVPVDFLKGKEDQDEAYRQWNQLTEKEKIKESPIYAKVDRHNKALERLTEARTDQTIRRLGITNEGGNWTIKDKRKVSQFILDELERRELPRNLAYGLEINPQTKDFTQPLEANAQYSKIRSVIYSVMEKTIMRPKVSGGQKTMLSVTGFEKGPRVVQREVNGKPVYTADTLKFYKRGKDGTEACEVMLPYWMGKQLKAMGSERTKEEVIKYLNSTTEGQKLLRGIGFRIPTQGLNSVDFFVVKDFLPEAMGDVIVLPSEITAKAGSDFDIDKLNTYLRNFYVDNTTGYPKAVQWKGTPEKTREYIQKLLDEGNIISAKDKKELDRYLAEERDMLSEFEFDKADLIARIPGLMDKFSDETITREFLGDYANILVDKAYMQSLENEYFDSIESILSDKETYSRLITPNDASQLKEDRDYIKSLIAEREGESDENLGNYGKLLDSTFMMKERHAYLMSKGVVGTSAVSQTAHAISQMLPGGLVVTDPDIVARFPHNTIEGKISMSGLTISGSDQYISNVNSQTTDGGVDVAKDKFLAEMGINKDTLGIYLALRRMGAPRKWAELFLNQQSVQKYLQLKAIADNVSKINKTVKKEPQWKTSNKVLRGLGFDISSKQEYLELMQGKPTQYTMKDMAEAIKTKNLTREQRQLQAWILDDFLKYNSLGWDLFHFYQGYNWDTARLNDPNEIRIKQLKFLKADNKLGSISMISPVGNVMKGTFIGQMKQDVERLNNGLKSIINVQVGEAGRILDDIAYDLFKQSRLTQYDRTQLMLAAELSMVDYAIQTNGMIGGKPISSYIQRLLTGPKSVAHYVKAMQEMKDIRIANNPFIKNLLTMIDKRADWPSTTVLGERDYDTYTSNVWTDAFRELKNDATVVSINDNRNDDKSVEQIYRNLILAAIVQTGSKRTSASLTHLIPNETYSEFTRDSLKQMRLGNFYENLAFYRNNWNNDKLVPVIPPIWDDVNLDNYYYPLFRGKDSMLTDTLKQLTGSDSPAQLLKLEAWKYEGNKVVKIKETHNLVTGDRYSVPLIRLFERIDIKDEKYGTLPVVALDFPKDIFFKEINAWGDGNNVQEYHAESNLSVLPANRKVQEVTNEQVLYALNKAGYNTNIANELGDYMTDINNKFNNDPDMDEETDNESPDNDPQGPAAPPSSTAEAVEPEENLPECGPSNFSVKNQKE